MGLDNNKLAAMREVQWDGTVFGMPSVVLWLEHHIGADLHSALWGKQANVLVLADQARANKRHSWDPPGHAWRLTPNDWLVRDPVTEEICVETWQERKEKSRVVVASPAIRNEPDGTVQEC